MNTEIDARVLYTEQTIYITGDQPTYFNLLWQMCIFYLILTDAKI